MLGLCILLNLLISSERIFAEFSATEGLGESEVVAIDNLLAQDARKFELFSYLPTQLKKPELLLEIRILQT